jgi:hypothetical protein
MIRYSSSGTGNKQYAPDGQAREVSMGHSANIKIQSVTKLVDDGVHNAFTDLCRFRDVFYLTYRACPDGHMIHATSQIVVLQSRDAISWEEVHKFGVPNRDVRDPHFLLLGQRLFVLSGTWPVVPGDPYAKRMEDHQGFGSWTPDGTNWRGPGPLEGTHGFYIWRAAARDGLAVMNGRKKVGDDVENWLLQSRDGERWEPLTRIPGYGNETASVFDRDGGLTVLCRGPGTEPASLCRADPPYQQWSCTVLDRQVGGPLLARWGDAWFAGGRRYDTDGGKVTALYWLEGGLLREAAVLPSGGDNSYPGFLQTGNRSALLSYYSSHEAGSDGSPPANIYLARLKLRRRLRDYLTPVRRDTIPS